MARVTQRPVFYLPYGITEANLCPMFFFFIVRLYPGIYLSNHVIHLLLGTDRTQH